MTYETPEARSQENRHRRRSERSGKTTFAEQFLPGEAGKIMLAQIAARVKAGKSFAFETTLSGLGYARSIRRWRAAGYHVKLIFSSLPLVELALARIQARVAQGGHPIPEDVVRRRFGRGVIISSESTKLVNSWILYDNSSPTLVLVDSGDNP